MILLDQLSGGSDGFPADLVLQSTLHGFGDLDRDHGFGCPQERTHWTRVGLSTRLWDWTKLRWYGELL